MWAQLLVMLLGLWLMAAPSVLDYEGTAGHSDHIVGPLLASFAAVALWEVTRDLRWVNLILGVWLIAAPWLLGFETSALINSTAVGVLVAALSLVRGRTSDELGGGWSMLWRTS